MSNPNKQDREGWLRGEEPGAQADEFARHAAQGRKELTSEAEARELLSELDGLLATRFGDPAQVGAAAGAEKVVESRPPAKIRRLGRWYAAAAAILLLLAAGSWWATHQHTYDSDAVFADAFSPYANELSGRTMGDDTTTRIGGSLGEALLAYDRREYPAAVAAFEAHFLAPPTSIAPATAPQLQLYYGISLLGANQAETALPVLAALQKNAAYGAAASWYHALALLAIDQTATTRTALQEIANDQSSPFHDQAKNLLEKIPL